MRKIGEGGTGKGVGIRMGKVGNKADGTSAVFAEDTRSCTLLAFHTPWSVTQPLPPVGSFIGKHIHVLNVCWNRFFCHLPSSVPSTFHQWRRMVQGLGSVPMTSSLSSSQSWIQRRFPDVTTVTTAPSRPSHFCGGEVRRSAGVTKLGGYPGFEAAPLRYLQRQDETHGKVVLWPWRLGRRLCPGNLLVGVWVYLCVQIYWLGHGWGVSWDLYKQC